MISKRGWKRLNLRLSPRNREWRIECYNLVFQIYHSPHATDITHGSTTGKETLREFPEDRREGGEDQTALLEGAATDVNGFYSITKVPPGDYILTVTSVEFDTLEVPIELKKNALLTKKLYVKKKVVQIQTVDISAEKQERQTEVKVSVNTITPRELQQIPTVGGEPDLVQYLQVLPGVRAIRSPVTVWMSIGNPGSARRHTP